MVPSPPAPMACIALEALERQSTVYADMMLEQLAEFNRQYPGDPLSDTPCLDPPPSAEGELLHARFRQAFFLYMANRHVLVPSEASPASLRPSR